MSRKRKWRAPNTPTPEARQVWSALFPGHPWPKGWRCEWAENMRNELGETIHGRRQIRLSYGDAIRHHQNGPEKGPVEALLHEFVHVRSKGTPPCARVPRSGE